MDEIGGGLSNCVVLIYSICIMPVKFRTSETLLSLVEILLVVTSQLRSSSMLPSYSMVEPLLVLLRSFVHFSSLE
jgi:hypothetical protein